PAKARTITIKRINPSPPLGQYPQPELYGQAGSAPIKSRIRMINRMVPIAFPFSNMFVGARHFGCLGSELRQLTPDFVGDHFADFPVFRETTLGRIGYAPIHDPLCCHHIAEVRHVHLGDIVELDVRKSGKCLGLWPLKSQPTSRMTLLIDVPAGLY